MPITITDNMKREYEIDFDPTSEGWLPVISKSNYKSYAKTTAAALSLETTARTDFKGRSKRVLQIEVTFSAAPTTSENLTLTRNTPGPTQPVTVAFSTDPAATSATSILKVFEGGYMLGPDDEVTLAYTNTDTKTIDAEITVEVL